jgi:hypothetical protein
VHSPDASVPLHDTAIGMPPSTWEEPEDRLEVDRAAAAQKRDEPRGQRDAALDVGEEDGAREVLHLVPVEVDRPREDAGQERRHEVELGRRAGPVRVEELLDGADQRRDARKVGREALLEELLGAQPGRRGIAAAPASVASGDRERE